LITNRLPLRLVYPREYFEILGLLTKEAAGQAIEEHLRRRLCRVLSCALETVPYYQGLRLGIEPRELNPDNCERALEMFPFLEKQAVLERPESFISSRCNPARLLRGSSSGSTGQGTKVYSTYRLTLSLWAFYHYQWSKIGFHRGCRFVRIGSDALKPTDQDPFTRLCDKLFISPTHLDDKWREAIAAEILRHDAEFVHSYPSCIADLADYCAQRNRTFPSVRGLFLASEHVFEFQLDVLQRVFPNAVIQFGYGLSERTNLAWGERRPGGIRYAVEPVYGFTESYRHGDGRSEIVGTSYWNEVMPLIRYRTQDFGAISGKYIEQLDGRDQEFLTTRQGNRLSVLFFYLDHFGWDFVQMLVMVQNEPGKIELHVKPRPSYSKSAGERIVAAFQERWGDLFTFSLVLANEMPRTARGKQHWVINNLARRQKESGAPVVV
jgi:phenylacetate-CoA ligase